MTFLDKCKAHGKESEYLHSKIAKAFLCVKCVEAGFFREDITIEIKKKRQIDDNKKNESHL